MPTLSLPIHGSTLNVSEIPVVVSSSGGTAVVTGWDANPAAGRTVLVLGRNVWGWWAVKGETRTNEYGEFSVSVNAGPSEPLIALCIGDPAHGEYTRVLGNLTVA